MSFHGNQLNCYFYALKIFERNSFILRNFIFYIFFYKQEEPRMSPINTKLEKESLWWTVGGS